MTIHKVIMMGAPSLLLESLDVTRIYSAADRLSTDTISTRWKLWKQPVIPGTFPES